MDYLSISFAFWHLLAIPGQLPIDAISLEVAFDRVTYKAGDDIWRELRLTNKGPNAIAIPADITGISGLPGSLIMRLERDGEVVPCQGSTASATLPTTSCSVVVLAPNHT